MQYIGNYNLFFHWNFHIVIQNIKISDVWLYLIFFCNSFFLVMIFGLSFSVSILRIISSSSLFWFRLGGSLGCNWFFWLNFFCRGSLSFGTLFLLCVSIYIFNIRTCYGLFVRYSFPCRSRSVCIIMCVICFNGI